MSKILITVLLAFATSSNAQNKQQMEKQQIETLIKAYAGAVDAQNITAAAVYLDEGFRLVLNNYPSKGNVTTLSREQYLDMMQSGKVGGNPRNVKVELIDVHQSVAMAKAVLEGDKNTFNTYYNLIKKDEKWLIISDMPQVSATVKN